MRITRSLLLGAVPLTAVMLLTIHCGSTTSSGTPPSDASAGDDAATQPDLGPFDPPSLGAGCDRFHYVADGTTCTSGPGCKPFTCQCPGESFPRSVTACTANGCVVGGQCFAICAAEFGEAVSCADKNVVPKTCFEAQPKIPVGSRAYDVVIGDLDGDKKLDLVVADWSTSVSVLLGDGTGGFGAPVTTTASLFAPTLADVRGTGRPDLLAVTYRPGSLIAFRNEGGTLSAPERFTACDEAQGMDAADFDGDGKIDAVVACKKLQVVQVMKNDGKGGFVAGPTAKAGGSDKGSLQYVRAADLDGDGKPDAVSLNIPDKSLGVFFNRGDGTLSDERVLTLGGNPWDLRIADVNGDGKLDLVAATDAGLTVLYGRGSRVFSQPIHYSSGANPLKLELIDFSGDGKLDAVTAAGASLVFTRNVGNGAFGLQATLPFAAGTSRLAAGDVNGDGKIDIVASTDPTSGGTSGVTVFLNRCP